MNRQDAMKSGNAGASEAELAKRQSSKTDVRAGKHTQAAKPGAEALTTDTQRISVERHDPLSCVEEILFSEAAARPEPEPEKKKDAK